MRIFEDVRQCRESFENLVLTIGSFDGLHNGHMCIVEHVKRLAATCGGQSALMYLHPHPREYFAPNSAPHWITSDQQRREILEAAGLDILFVLPFNASVARMDREAFVREIVVERCQARTLVVGHDFNFGKGARGNFEYLQEVAPQFGFSVEQVPALISEGERISSTLIRELIMEGEMARVRHFLGRDYQIHGHVVRNRGMGAKLGYPTANLDAGRFTMPAFGIYAAEARWRDQTYMAAVNVGIAPTLAHDSATIEAHLLDFEGELDNEVLALSFLKRLRPEAKFESLEALIEAIGKDVEAVRNFFAARVLN